jgi:transcriptional regulator
MELIVELSDLIAAQAGVGRDMLERAEYAMKSMKDVRRLIREHGWALLVVGRSGDLRAAHVPCLLDPVHDAGGAAEQLVIIGHTAREDPVVSELLSGQQVLLVFQGPNGYISPACYREGPSLPTWNFTAVHVRGIPEVLEGGEAFSVLERTVEHFEAAGTTRGSCAGTRWHTHGGSHTRRLRFGSAQRRSRPRRS